MARKQKIFISYRREDAADVAGRIRDWLVQIWNIPQENVFMDVATILPGADFEHVIDQAIAQCDAMIVVISPSWRTHVNAAGVSYPRYEAEAALRRNLQIIPVLVGGMATPTEEQLPETLLPLLRRNIRPIRAESFDYDMEWVRRALGVQRVRRRSLVAAISAILLIAIILLTLSQVPAGNPLWRAFHSSASSGPTSGPTDGPSSSNPGPVPVISSSEPTVGPTAPTEPVALPKRDCLPYNPDSLTIQPFGDGAFRLISPEAGAMLLLDNQRDADSALTLGRSYHQYCFLGRGNTRPDRKQYIFEYWLQPDDAVVAIPNADCLKYNPTAVRYEPFGTGFRLIEDLGNGQGSAMALLDNEQDAQDAVAIAKRYTQQCFIGRDNQRSDREDYIVQYWQ
jgi:hypothetical protein